MAGSVRILLFAGAREAVGQPRLMRNLGPDGAELADLLGSIEREYPRLGPVLRISRIVLNGRFLAKPQGRVRPGDEIAVHPPYSGG